MYQLPKFTSLFLLLCLLISCGETLRKAPEKPRISLSESQIDSVLEEIKFSYNSPIEPDSSDYLIFPLSAYSDSRDRANLIASVKSGYSSEGYPGYWNFLFFHPDSHESHLLAESKMLIGDYEINIPQAGPILSHSILLTIRNTDYDQDGELNSLDPKYLYLAKQDGKGLVRISPENENLIQYKIRSQKDEIVFQTHRDTDQDGKYTEKDPIHWYYVNLGKENQPIQIVHPEQEKEIERLFFDQWVNNPNK